MGGTFSGGNTRAVTEEDLERYEELRELQPQQRVPLLQRADDPNAFVYVALFDGTGQDVDDPRQLATNVGELSRQLRPIADDEQRRIGFTYVEGIGTRTNAVARAWDGAVAHTWDEKIETAYRELAVQAWVWK